MDKINMGVDKASTRAVKTSTRIVFTLFCMSFTYTVILIN
jgi:hypothetical protein